jgi:caa(3)-type oxidase subunit IV
MSEESHEHDESYYIKTWVILVVLLIVSVLGPELEIQIVTFITAFGIAVVKASLVANRFMHLNIEKKYITYLLLTGIALLLIFFYGVAPDVMRHSGTNWENVASQQWVEEHMAIGEANEGHHGGAGHGDDAGHDAGHGDASHDAGHGDASHDAGHGDASHDDGHGENAEEAASH